LNSRNKKMTNNQIKKKDEGEQQYLNLKEKEYRLEDLAVGTIQKLWLTCGKQNCKCMKGKKHGPYYYLVYTRTEDKKTSPVCISKDKVPDLERRLNNFKKLECEVRDLLDLEFRHKK